MDNCNNKYFLILLLLLLLTTLCYANNRASVYDVRLELLASPKFEIYGAAGISRPKRAFMAFACRIDSNYLFGVYEEKFEGFEINDIVGLWGSRRVGGAYIFGEESSGIITGVSVGMYLNINDFIKHLNFQITYTACTYVKNNIYRYKGQLYIGLAGDVGIIKFEKGKNDR